MKEEKTGFSERLRAALRQAGIDVSATALEKRFNARYGGSSVTSQAVSQWLNGRTMPRPDKMRALAELLGVEVGYLRDGEKRTVRIGDDRPTWPAAISVPDRAALEAFLVLPPAHRKLARELILALVVTAAAKVPPR